MSPLSLSVSWNCGLTTERISGNSDAAGLAELQCNDADAASVDAVCPDRVLGSRGVVECQVTRPLAALRRAFYCLRYWSAFIEGAWYRA